MEEQISGLQKTKEPIFKQVEEQPIQKEAIMPALQEQEVKEEKKKSNLNPQQFSRLT